jgi:predicted transposase YbfD/YdcC
LKSIVSSGNNFTIQVKGNTPKLLASLETILATTTHKDTHIIEEKKNGRKTTWQSYCYSYEQKIKEWQCIETLIVICKTVIEPTKITHTRRYYVSNVKVEELVSAKTFNIGIRGHWDIENKAHKNKDVVFKQDENKVKNSKHAVNRAIFNTIALNFLIDKYSENVTYSQILFRAQFQKLCFKNRT